MPETANTKKQTPKKSIELFDHTGAIAKMISDTYDIERPKSREIVTEVLNGIQDLLLDMGVASFKNFGSFRVNHHDNMKFFDFSSGKVKVQDRNVLVFYPATRMKKMINQVNHKLLEANKQKALKAKQKTI